MACGAAHIRVVLPVATFILAALVLRSWSPENWPRPWVAALLAWSVDMAYCEVGNVVCAKTLRVIDGLDALSVQMFVSSTQSASDRATVAPRTQYSRVMAWGGCMGALLWCVWRRDPGITVNPCVPTMIFIVTGRRDALALASVLGCVPVAWQMAGAY